MIFGSVSEDLDGEDLGVRPGVWLGKTRTLRVWHSALGPPIIKMACLEVKVRSIHQVWLYLEAPHATSKHFVNLSFSLPYNLPITLPPKIPDPMQRNKLLFTRLHFPPVQGHLFSTHKPIVIANQKIRTVDRRVPAETVEDVGRGSEFFCCGEGGEGCGL